MDRSATKILLKFFVEFFAYFYEENDIESIKSFYWYFERLQCGFKIIYKFDIKIRKGENFKHADYGLFHVVDKICKEMQEK